MIDFLDKNQLYKQGEGQNYIYQRIDGRIVMTYDALTIVSYLT